MKQLKKLIDALKDNGINIQMKKKKKCICFTGGGGQQSGDAAISEVY